MAGGASSPTLRGFRKCSRRSSLYTARSPLCHNVRVIVVAAVIEQDGRLLICRRKQGARHPLKWEFPGGKVEPGESPRAALKRELEEELAIRATIGREIVRYEHQYPRRRPILLIFFRVARFEGVMRNNQFEEIRWEKAGELPQYDFLDGDLDFIRRLSRGEFRDPG
ncbi:MAG: (deoxy)nucleoside triphosphate pyrophosphohydrolase [Bryobacteraceae bacterium]|nr:(deoxy)nucleoside triphosphate pyrophosphohydrolase [Bryobacteraceae bacterium]